MRKLNTGDAFKLARLLRACDIVPLLQNMREEGKKPGADQEKIGFELLFSLLNLAADKDKENLVYDLFGGVLGVTPESVPEIPLDDMIDNIKQIAEMSNISRFFEQVSSIWKKA